ncbi:hypothetical protein [Roseobacter sp. GAI101]|uniref:hypothetical protein n=1 Tax=Roseobacter sp. (strain GAI101) TaxID=391589 RepID=UPI0012EE2489|nr:hypothetical protein [Roseobacter sp. GAI101]
MTLIIQQHTAEPAVDGLSAGLDDLFEGTPLVSDGPDDGQHFGKTTPLRHERERFDDGLGSASSAYERSETGLAAQSCRSQYSIPAPMTAAFRNRLSSALINRIAASAFC